MEVINIIKPIETYYNGYRFRSRLEARWAVFFDVGKIKWEYEPEGFRNENGDYYLPDFYLPEFDTYVEVKANRPEAKTDIEKCMRMITWGGDIKRILILSDIPSGEKHHGLWHFPCLLWHGGADRVCCVWCYFYSNGNTLNLSVSSARYPTLFERDIGGNLTGLEMWNRRIKKFVKLPFMITAVRDSVLRHGRYRLYNYLAGEYKDAADAQTENDDDVNAVELQFYQNELVFTALTKSRQARFEHGEKPQI